MMPPNFSSVGRSGLDERRVLRLALKIMSYALILITCIIKNSRSGAHLHTRHTIGGAEEHLNNKWGPVVPLVFGHFGEFNKELLEFIGKISESIAAQHHRKLGFKSELGGRSRAKAGIMQRISMVALRATARQVIRGVALVGAANVQAHSDRRAEKTAEAAKYDAFGPNHGGAFRPFDCGRAA